MTVRVFALLSAAALLSACSGRVGPSASILPPTAGNSRAIHSGGTLDYISTATRGMSVTITGPTKFKRTVGLTMNSRGCSSTLMTVQCALSVPGLSPCPSSKNCYTASVATYDKFDAAHNKIPHGAHLLSAERNFGFSIRAGSNVIPLLLQGVPKSIAFLPSAKSVLSGNQSSGFVLPKCNKTAQKVTLVGVDADGNEILGVGAPKMSLKSDGRTQLSVGEAKATSPNAFTLDLPKPPAYAYGNHTVNLTATATPGSKSGATAASAIVKITYSGDICGTFTEFTIPSANSEPYGITTGPDGNLWFTEQAANKVGRITTTGKITEFAVPSSSSGPAGIVTGPDGNLWFAESAASKVASITTAGTIVEFPTITANSVPFNIANAPDGNLWFTEQRGNIAKITTAGAVTEYAVPTGGYAYTNPYGITTGPDGALWFTELTGNDIGRITTAGSLTQYPVPTVGSFPADIATGADGALWFTECAGNKIGRITTSGDVTSEYPTPDINPTSPTFATLGPDGNVWFSESGVNKIASITVGGAFAEFAIPTVGAEPYHITTGPDGAVWFVEYATGKIGRLR
ncbi:MAG TPA: hypothetical protein VNG31_08125 [Candidatus Baltobacteraceae bacterium]|nr:hypothetical protein [Candidatus Baltobacteraceae bacterium]